MRLAAALFVALLLTACGSEPDLVVPFDPTVAEAEIPVVLDELRRGAPEEALARLDERAAAGTLPAGAEHYRAIALMDAGRTDEARAAWEAEVARHPGNGRAHAFLAELLIEDGELDAAAEHLAAARRHAPDFAATSLLAGRLALLRDEDGLAERAFTDYLDSDPYGPEAALAHESLKQIFARRGPDGADRAQYHADIAAYLREVHRFRAGYRRRLLADPEDAEAAYGVAMTYLNLFFRTADGDERLLAEADRALQRVLEIDPDHARALANFGSVRAIQRRFDDARALFTRAVELDPEQFDAHVQLGLLDARDGALDASRGHFEDALAVADDDVARAEVHAKWGLEFSEAEPAEALEHLRTYLALAPDDPARLVGRIAELEAALAEG